MKETTPGYQTGPTKPPKSHHMLLALLLVLVIFLGGLATVLGILNIRLFHRLSLQNSSAAPISFTQKETYQEDAATAASHDALGLATETVTPFLQSYYDLPAGVYITHVEDGSAAQKAGLFIGDIILAVGDAPTPDQQTLQTLLDALPQGNAFSMTVYQDGEETILNLRKE